jgi:hypothetical protein
MLIPRNISVVRKWLQNMYCNISTWRRLEACNVVYQHDVSTPVFRLCSLTTDKLIDLIFVFSIRKNTNSITYIYQIKEDEVGRTCGTHGKGEKHVQAFGGKARRK